MNPPSPLLDPGVAAADEGGDAAADRRGDARREVEDAVDRGDEQAAVRAGQQAELAAAPTRPPARISPPPAACTAATTSCRRSRCSRPARRCRSPAPGRRPGAPRSPPATTANVDTIATRAHIAHRFMTSTPEGASGSRFGSSRDERVRGRTWTVETAEAGQRLDKFLAAADRAGSRSRAADALARGRVFVDDAEMAGGGRRASRWPPARSSACGSIGRARRRAAPRRGPVMVWRRCSRTTR